MLAGAVGFTVLGLVRFIYSVDDYNYFNMSRLNEKYERAYVEQAREDVAWERRQKEILDKERSLMASVSGWVVGQRRYLTQWEDKPDKDQLDTRKPGPW
jgi:hypothetical protein